MNDREKFVMESDSVNVEDLQERIVENAQMRRKKGIMIPEVLAQINKKLPEEGEGGSLGSPLAELDFSSAQAGRTWQVSTSYPIATKKKWLRPLVIFVKRLGRLWARIAVGPIQRDQTTFNRYVARGLGAIREQAINASTEARAREYDLCMIAESLSSPIESEELGKACVRKLQGIEHVFMIGPAPPKLACYIMDAVELMNLVYPSTSWDGPVVSNRVQMPTSFLEEIEDESASAIMIPEICFWLRPERILSLCRKAYIKLKQGGVFLSPVRGFALRSGSGGAWCEPELLCAILGQVGFNDVEIEEITLEGAPSREHDEDAICPFLASAVKP